MENIAETGQFYEAERQIKIVRTEAAAETELLGKAQRTEHQELVEAAEPEKTSTFGEPEGVIYATGVEPAPADQKIELAWDEMKAGYRYASGLFHGRSLRG
jgi:hypothetical protein